MSIHYRLIGQSCAFLQFSSQKLLLIPARGAGGDVISQCDLWAVVNVVSFCTFSLAGPAQRLLDLIDRKGLAALG